MTHAATIVAWATVAALALLLLAPQQTIRVDAGQVASSDGFTMLTAQSSDPRASGGRELLYLVDHRSGVMMVYGVQRNESGAHPVLLDGGPMAALFGTPTP